MKNNLDRRSFLKRAALAATAVSAAQFFCLPALRSVTSSHAVGDKLRNCVQIGCGGRGMSHLGCGDWSETPEFLYALVDPDEKKHLARSRVG